MNATQLLAHFEKISDEADTIQKLRRFILDLAVRGKLVPQDPKDCSASALLSKIYKEKERLTKEGMIKQPKPLPQHSQSPFNIPANWSWSQIAEIGVLSPRNEARDDTEASFVPMPLIAAEYGVPNQHEVRAWGEIKKGYTHFAEGDVGLAKITPCFENGKSAVFRDLTGGFGSGTTELHIVRPLFVNPDYILLFLKSPHFIETGIPKMTGTAGQKRVPTEYFAHSAFPLPPLAEQHRIVARVDELMALCDRLQAARAERESRRDRLAASSLVRLNMPDPSSFQDDVRFALDVFPAITARPDQVKQLRQTILNLAVQGGLSQQDSWTHRAKKLGEVASLQNGYAFKSEWFSKSGTRLLRNANVAHGVLDWEEEVRLPDDRLLEFERFRLNEGDIVVSLDRPFIASGTKVARIRAKDMPALLLQRVGRFVVQPLLDSDYLFLWVTSPHFAGQIDPGRSNGVPHISSKQVEAAEIFVPPLVEQKRIVAKVDELMDLCDRLEASLRVGEDRRSGLLSAILSEALRPADERDQAA
jgi:type I restriction enzyme S subunit